MNYRHVLPGEFGIVYKGYHITGQSITEIVAMKTIKGMSSRVSSRVYNRKREGEYPTPLVWPARPTPPLLLIMLSFYCQRGRV